MPFVNIRIVKKSSPGTPKARNRRWPKRCDRHVGEPRRGGGQEDVWVVFEEVAARDWYVGDDSVEALRKKRGG